MRSGPERLVQTKAKANAICLLYDSSLARCVGFHETSEDYYYIMRVMHKDHPDNRVGKSRTGERPGGDNTIYASAVGHCFSLAGVLPPERYAGVEQIFALNGGEPMEGFIVSADVDPMRAVDEMAFPVLTRDDDERDAIARAIAGRPARVIGEVLVDSAQVPILFWPGFGVTLPGHLTTNGDAGVLVDLAMGRDAYLAHRRARGASDARLVVRVADTDLCALDEATARERLAALLQDP